MKLYLANSELSPGAAAWRRSRRHPLREIPIHSFNAKISYVKCADRPRGILMDIIIGKQGATYNFDANSLQ